MKIKDTAIVLNAVKYSDSKNIVKLYGLQSGVISLIANVSSSKSSKIKPSVLSPLNIVEIDFDSKENRNINSLLEANTQYVYQSIHNDLNKLSVFQFLREVLNTTLVEESKNSELFFFIIDSLKEFDQNTVKIGNFHLRFMLQLIEYFGFSPSNNYSDVNRFFDCLEGKFEPIEKAYPIGLNEPQSKVIHYLLSSDNTRSLSNNEKQNALEGILAYYS
ncbi:MAG: DNA repair protein RecO, partial [Flavobacteriales bacterium]|nr:DNA repair protein RecO [Flavobacteriales bacterium]